MRLELTARHFTLTAPVRKLVAERLDRALRPLNNGAAVSAQIVITREKTRFRAEVNLHARGEHFLHGEATGRDAQTAVAASIDKVDRQVQKLKGKWADRKRQPVPPAAAMPRERDADGAQQPKIIRARRYAVRPLSVDEAATEVAEGRDAFLVFRNASTKEINVLFRRPDGNLGLIEPDA